MFATSVPIFVLMAVYGAYGAHLEKNRSPGEAVPSALVAETTYERQELPAKAADKAGLSVEEPRPYSLCYTYSLIIAIVCGTAGLPHILVHFYTNSDGAAAKRTFMWVMILIGVFYLSPGLRPPRTQSISRTLSGDRSQRNGQNRFGTAASSQ